MGRGIYLHKKGQGGRAGRTGVYTHSKENNESISKGLRGHVHSDETRKKLKMNYSRRIERGEKFGFVDGHSPTRETRSKISKALEGKIPASIQVPGKFGHVHRGYYTIEGKEYFFRSRWEVNYAIYLNFLIKQKQVISWEYEPESFLFEKIRSGTRTYRPDFRVVLSSGSIEYHEVKGWMDPKSLTKLKRMRIYFPEVKMVVIDEEVYTDIKKKLGALLKFY